MPTAFRLATSSNLALSAGGLSFLTPDVEGVLPSFSADVRSESVLFNADESC